MDITDLHIDPNRRFPRNRDMRNGCQRAQVLQNQCEALLKSRDLELIGRVFHSSSGGLASVSYASLIDAQEQLISNEPKEMINLGSSDYAGLNKHPRVIKAASEALLKFGNSSTGGRLLNGTTSLHVLLERKLANFLNVEDVVTFNSGFCANLSVFSTLCAQDDVVISDIFNHQSIIDGLKLGGAEVITYIHRNMRGTARSVEGILKGIPNEKRKFIVSDGIFSLDGDIAPLDEIISLADEYNAFIIIDEAHAIGAFGPCGRGTVAYYSAEDQVDLITGALSKGLPGIGGFAAGSKQTIDLLRFGSHGYIFSSALPPSVVAGLIEAIDILLNDLSIQERLSRNINYLREGIEALGFYVHKSQSAIIPIPMPDSKTALNFARLLHEDGIYINPAIYPAASPLRPILRVNVNANLALEEIDRALQCIGHCMQKIGLHLFDLDQKENA